MLRAGHAQIGHIAGALGQHLGVGSGHMGVGAPQSADPAIQHVAHSQLFGGGFRVDLHQNDFRVNFLQGFFHHQEGVVRAVVHIAPANQVDHGYASRLGVKGGPASAGHLGGIVGGPEDLGAVVHVRHDVPLGPGVIAHGNHIGTGVQNLLALLGGHTHHRRVLSVDDYKIRACFAFQVTQRPADPVHTGATHHIAYSQHLEIHSHSPFPIEAYIFSYYTRKPHVMQQKPRRAAGVNSHRAFLKRLVPFAPPGIVSPLSS